MTWFLLSLLSVFALTIGELSQQHLLNLKKAFSERTSVVFTLLIQSLLTIPIIFFPQYRNEIFNIFQLSIIPKVVLVSLVASFGMIFYFKSFKVKNISLSIIFVSASIVVSTILGILFFNEGTSVLKLSGIILILTAIVSLNFKNADLEKNHVYGLLAGLMFGVAYTLDKSVLMDIKPPVYIFWGFFLTSLVSFLINPKDVLNSVKGKSFNAFIPVLIAGLGFFFYNFFTFNAYRAGGEVGRVDAINNSEIFILILFEYFILKHTDSMFRKLATAAIAFVGVAILGMS